jgi:hypothetical protein
MTVSCGLRFLVYAVFVVLVEFNRIYTASALESRVRVQVHCHTHDRLLDPNR